MSLENYEYIILILNLKTYMTDLFNKMMIEPGLCLRHNIIAAHSVLQRAATCLAYAEMALAHPAGSHQILICSCHFVSLVAIQLLQLLHSVPQRQALRLWCLLSPLEATPDSLCHLGSWMFWLVLRRAGLEHRSILMHCCC